MLLTRQGISLTLLPVFPVKVKWGPDISAGLCMSPYSSDYLLSNLELDSGVQSLRILEDGFESFLLITCTRRIVTRIFYRVARDAQAFQHMAGFY
jgi:hypothetical protein